MLEEIFKKVAKTDYATIVFTKDIPGNKPLKKYNQAISLKTEISLNEGLKIFHLYIALKEPYSTCLPKIFIDEKSYEDIKYIPHINRDLSICVIDENENFNFRVQELPELTSNLIAKAKDILRGRNDPKYLKAEFEREFSAYWDISYTREQYVKETGLYLIDFDNFQNLKAIKLLNKIGIYEYVIYNIEEEFNLFKNYLEKRNIRYKSILVFIAEYPNVLPPFRISYSDSIQLLINKSEFKSRINRLLPEDFLMVFKGSQNELFGWRYLHLNKKTNGFRPMSNWQFLNSPLSKIEYVNRLGFSNIRPIRLDKRTSGLEVDRSLNVAVIGLGSVGSNLLYYLMKYPILEYCLIDPDTLKVENVFRHKYGFDFMSNFKTKVSEYEILNKNPFTKVKTYEKRISEVFNESPSLLENYDFRFVVLGITRIEKYIIQHLISIDSQKPIILLWVEPYLASGQMVYLHPREFNKGLDLIEDYPYHVIEKSQKTSMKEGSCQTVYMPYSDLHLGLFLSAINTRLYNMLIANKITKSTAISWVGDLDLINSLGFKLNSCYDLKDKFKVFENEL